MFSLMHSEYIITDIYIEVFNHWFGTNKSLKEKEKLTNTLIEKK